MALLVPHYLKNRNGDDDVVEGMRPRNEIHCTRVPHPPWPGEHQHNDTALELHTVRTTASLFILVRCFTFFRILLVLFVVVVVGVGVSILSGLGQLISLAAGGRGMPASFDRFRAMSAGFLQWSMDINNCNGAGERRRNKPRMSCVGYRRYSLLSVAACHRCRYV